VSASGRRLIFATIVSLIVLVLAAYWLALYD
jgi:hypothetical protein